jgi:hypothetical protein
MKFKLTVCFYGCAAITLFTLPAMAAVIDFNSAGDLTANFTVVGTGAARFSEGATVGLGASRGLNATGNTSPGAAILTSGGFGPLGFASATVGMYFQSQANTSASGSTKVLMLGWNTSLALNPAAQTAPFASTAIFAGLEQRATGPANTFRVLSIGQDAGASSADVTAPASTTVTMTPGNWYYFETTLTTNAVNDFRLSATLYNSDSAGLVGSPLQTIVNTSIASSLFGGAASVYPFFGQSGGSSSRGMGPLDNFTYNTVPVPEPGSATILALAAVLLGYRQRVARR